MRVLVFFGLLLLLAIFLNATTINVPSEQPTIQAGIDAAVDGDGGRPIGPLIPVRNTAKGGSATGRPFGFVNQPDTLPSARRTPRT